MAETSIEKEQRILNAGSNYEELDDYIREMKLKKIFLVCGSSMKYLKLDEFFEHMEKRIGVEVIRFSEFSPNPSYESVVAGVKVFQAEKCDSFIAVGGGSAIDVAKCVRLYSRKDTETFLLTLKEIDDDIHIPFLAVPTTAGSGSEATRFAVLYYDGEKKSITGKDMIPDAVLFDPCLLKSLPAYQKRAAMADAFCHAVESLWSIHSTEKSREYASAALRLILENMDSYLSDDVLGSKEMLKAANLAGKAINISRTTAGHAMSYKLTGIYGIAHGHAAFLCLVQLLPYTVEHLDQCADPRGEKYLTSVLENIYGALGCSNEAEVREFLDDFLKKLKFTVPTASERELEVLTRSVNIERLKNHPIHLGESDIYKLYQRILGENDES